MHELIKKIEAALLAVDLAMDRAKIEYNESKNLSKDERRRIISGFGYLEQAQHSIKKALEKLK